MRSNSEFGMFKSKKGFHMKSNEELQSYVICLRKQLAVSLNENRILKIKMQRLENDILKKNAHIQNLVATNKDFDIKKLVKQHGKGLILNMQKQIHILEEKLLQNELSHENVKHKKSDYKILKRKESKASTHSYDSVGLDQRSLSVDEIKASGDKSVKLKGNKSCNGDENGDWEIDDSCLNIIKMLKEQTNTEKYDNKMKNNQISYLLNKLKSFKKATSEISLQSRKSESVLSTARSSRHTSSTLNPDDESRESGRFRSEHNFNAPDSHKKVGPIEKSREMCSSHMFQYNAKHSNLDSKADIDGKLKKQKTPIEYLSDSEVSSDEEYSWQSNDRRCNDDEQFLYNKELF